MPRVKKIQVGKRLAVAREKADMYQQEVADEVGVAQTRISEWERQGWVPKAKLEDVSKALDVDPRWLREGVAPSDEGRYVDGEGAVNRWRDAVIDYYGAADLVCQILLALPKKGFLEQPEDRDERSGDWTVLTTIAEFVEGTGFTAEEVEAHCDRILDSPFLERYGEPVEWAFRLRFPTDDELEAHEKAEVDD
ncbi:MAG: helix-turn-helix domain-containing protein [Bradymonadaceae bacterium]